MLMSLQLYICFVQSKMDNSYPYPASDAPPPPGFSSNYAQSLYTTSSSQTPAQNMTAPATSTPGGNHTSTWNTSQMSFCPPTFPGSGNFAAPPMTFPHPFNPSLPPPQIGYPPPPGVAPVPSSWAPSGPRSGPHHSSLSGPPPGPPGPHSGPPHGPHPGPHYGPPPGALSGPPPGSHHGSFSGPPPGPSSSPHSGPHPGPPRGLRSGSLPSPGPPQGSLSGPHPAPHPGLPPGPQFGPLSGPPPGSHPGPGPRPGPLSGPPPFTQSNYQPRLSAQPSSQNKHREQFSESGHTFSCERETFAAPTVKLKPEDETTIQRREDQKWISQFLETKSRSIKNVSLKSESPPPNLMSVSEMKKTLHSTAQLVSQLSTICENMRLNMDNQEGWTKSYVKALKIKEEIQTRLKIISEDEILQRLKAKLSTIAKRRTRRLRAKKRLQMEEQHREAQIAEKDAAIEKWRMKKIHEEEEKKKEEELKRAADAVLCEVRKKQADVKRTQDILKSLEKLRKLRKEAASRKGIFTDQQSDEAFNKLLEELRSVAKKRTAVYAAEERALMVMLEGEQEEERRKELEGKQKRERDKQMQMKRKLDIMLFGDDTPPDPFMQPFRQYYTQAEHSLPALVQIRREWDSFLVPADHPEGSAVPQGWVLPDAPSDQTWALALQTSDTECEDV